MLTEKERSQLLSLLQTPQWGAVEAVANNLCDKLAYDSTIRASEWDTLSETLLKEGQIRGIRRLLQELYNHAGHNDKA